MKREEREKNSGNDGVRAPGGQELLRMDLDSWHADIGSSPMWHNVQSGLLKY